MRRALVLCAILYLGMPALARAETGLKTLGLTVETAFVDPAEDNSRIERPTDALPDGRPAVGTNDIAQVWLIAPTDRYDHGVLGDAIEAGGLRALLRDGTSADLLLDTDSVFEDLRPRLADLDGDGRDEIIVVRSYLDAGAALSVFGARDGQLRLLAETSPIGQANRWLNPVGAGDFNGDGRQEFAYVETPHIGGILRIVALEGGRLVEKGVRRGVSNHAIGSRALQLSAVLDFDGDGADDILIPTQGRKSLSIISFAGGTFRELASIAAPDSLNADFVVGDLDGNGRDDVSIPLGAGRAMQLKR